MMTQWQSTSPNALALLKLTGRELIPRNSSGMEIERRMQGNPTTHPRIDANAKRRVREVQPNPRTLMGGTTTPASTLAPIPPSIELSLRVSKPLTREDGSYPSILFADFGNSCKPLLTTRVAHGPHLACTNQTNPRTPGRSPMAEAILKHMTSSLATKFTISSGGTGGKTALAPTECANNRDAAPPCHRPPAAKPQSCSIRRFPGLLAHPSDGRLGPGVVDDHEISGTAANGGAAPMRRGWSRGQALRVVQRGSQGSGI